MSGFNVQQKATIDNYRSAKNLGFVISDEAVAELIKKEMEQSGTVYPGFENLAKSVAKSQILKTTQDAPSPVKPTTSIFGAQIVGNETEPFSIEKTTITYPEIQPTEAQSEAINFLKDLTNDAETTFQNREKEAGALSAVVNTWQEMFNKQYAKSTVKKELQTAKEDLRLLEQASKGQLGYTDFLGNTHIRNFEDVFKQSRGIKFDEKAVADCSEKAKQFAAIKTSVQMINQTKQMLGYTTKGDVHSQMNPQEASISIIKAFQLSGINSLEEMNKTLQDIEQKYKNHPDIQKYGGDFRFAKNKKGDYVIYRTAKNGYPAEATNEELKVIAKEMGIRLDKALATALGVEYSKNATAEEMANLTQQTYDKYQKEYENSFAKAYGKKDVKALSEAYVLKQQQGVANIEIGLNIASMALMVVPGGAVAASGWALKGALVAKHTATGAKVVKGLNLVGKAKTFVKGAQTLQKISQVASPFIMANMTLRPTELLEQLTSKNGMSADEWKAWGEGVIQNSIYMAAGMGASKLAETGAAMYKTKALVSTLKSAGKSTDEIMAMIKANPVKFPNEIVKSLDKVDTLAKTLQVSSEVALDIGSTVLVNKALSNGELLKQDVINSIAFAISGGVLQKQFMPLSSEAKVSFIQNALKEYGVNKTEAERILKTMDDISLGKVRAKDIKPLDNHQNSQILDEVVVTAERNTDTPEINNPFTAKVEMPIKSETPVEPQVKIEEPRPRMAIRSVTDEIALREMMDRYDVLKAEADKTGKVSEELLALTLELQEKGYGFKDGRLDFGYNRNDATLPNSTTTKADYKQELKALGLNDRIIDAIEYNINRVNQELLNVLKESPELLNSRHGISLLCDVKPEDVPAKVELFNALKENNLLSTNDKICLISRVGKENLETGKTQLTTINENLTYLKECNLPSESLTKYSQMMCEYQMDFCKELFDVLKVEPELVNAPNLCMNIKPEDVASKKELFDLLQNSKSSLEEKRSMLSQCNKDNVEKLKAFINNPHILGYYAPYEINGLNTADIDAKAKIYDIINGCLKIDNRSEIIKNATNENIDTYTQRANILKDLSSKEDMATDVLRDLGHTLFSEDCNPEAATILFNAIKNDIELLNTTTKDWFETKTIAELFKGLTIEDASAKAEIYKLTSELTPNEKSEILKRVNKDNLTDMAEEVQLTNKIKLVNNLTEPQFSSKELINKNNKLKTVEEDIDKHPYMSFEAKNQLKEIFRNIKCMEEFNAKYKVFVSMSEKSVIGFNGDAKTEIDIIDATKIMEQADVVEAIGMGNSMANDVDIIKKDFAQRYKYLKQIDSSFRPCSVDRMAHYLDFEIITSQKEFDRFKELWNDTQIKGASAVRTISTDAKKYDLYQKLKSQPDYYRTDGEVIKNVIEGIASGKIENVENISKISRQLEIEKRQAMLKEYQSNMARERYDWELQPATEADMQGLITTFPNINREVFQKYNKRTIRVINNVISRASNHSFEKLETLLNSYDLSNLDRRGSILDKCSPDVALKLTFCSDANFDNIVKVLQKRPEMLLEKVDYSVFEKMLNMTDSEWETFKLSIKERGTTQFDSESYAKDLQAKLDNGFVLDMSTYRGIERRRHLEANSGLGTKPKTVIKYEEPVKLNNSAHTTYEVVNVESLIAQLEQDGKVDLHIEDQGGMKPAITDPALIKEKDRANLGKAVSTETSINIGSTRAWENDRLARDLLQNFYDGNGYTLEGVSISVTKSADGKYDVKISGKGIFDYDRILDFGASSKTGDSRSAGRYGEGSKVITGNLLKSRGVDVVKYSAGNWEMELSAGKKNELGEADIQSVLTEAPQRQDGTSLEFSTTDTKLIESLFKAKDYFYNPNNKDFQNLDVENEYFGIKFLPEGEKGNIYVVQRYEVEGENGLDNTIDGMTIVFKKQSDDVHLMELNNGLKCELGTGRNRVELTKDKIEEMLTRYAKTLSDKELIDIIGSMKHLYLYDNKNENTYLLKGFTKVARERNLKIDFEHDDYIAVDAYPNASNIKFAKMMGKTIVTSDMADVGVPRLHDYINASKGQRTPVTELTEVQAQKLQILEETLNMFSDNLDLENCGVITKREAETPKYLYNPTEKDNTVAEAITSRVDYEDRVFEGHWVKSDYFDNADFFDLVATWLHETSHKVAGDGRKEFNDRLIKLQQLIVEMSSADPSFGNKLRILSNKFDEVSGNTNTDVPANMTLSTRETDKIISDLLRDVVKRAEENAKQKVEVQTQTLNNQVKTEDEVAEQSQVTVTTNKKSGNRLTRFFKKMFGIKDDKPVETKPTIPQNVDSAVVADEIIEYHYTSPSKKVRTKDTDITAPTLEENLRTLNTSGQINIDIHVSSSLNPVKRSTSIMAEDVENLGKTLNTKFTRDYNIDQAWDYNTIARDILQNFYDGHGGTLDGIKFDIQKVNGKYKVKISGQSEFSYYYLKTIGASTKIYDAKQAGGFGEGAKMASLNMLRNHATDKITFASGDWSLDFALEEGVQGKNQHMTRTINKNNDKVQGTYIEFETDNADLVESILKAKDYYRHSDNPDFKGLDYETDKFGFKILNTNERGNLYYNQRYAIKNDGELEGALKGISIVFKEELPKETKDMLGIVDDCDRRGLTAKEINSIANYMAESMTDKELMSAIQDLEYFWTIKDFRDIKGNRTNTPEESFALGLVTAARQRRLDFKTGDAKIAALPEYSWSINEDHVNFLRSQGYTIVEAPLSHIGFKTVAEVIAEMNKVVPFEGTIAEQQKLALIKEAMPTKFPLKVFEAGIEDKQVFITNENGETFIAVDRSYLANTDFNTLYTMILSQANYASDAAEWGYNMTDMIAKQLKLSKDANYITKFNALAKQFEQIQ